MASDASFALGPTFHPKTGEPYSIRGGLPTYLSMYSFSNQQAEPILEDQRERLTELGIEIPDNAEITHEEAQEIIDFYEGNPGLLSSMNLGSVQESITIVNRISNMGFGFGLSDYNPKSWGVEHLREFTDVLNTMSDTAANRFIKIYGEEALTTLARDMGLPEEQINDAALKLLVSGERTITLDEGIGTSVAYILGTEDDPRLWQSYKPENGVPFDYDPADYRLRLGGGNVSPEIQAEIARALSDENASNDPRNVVWYAQARGSGIVVSSHAFEAVELRGVVSGSTYTVQELVAHEFAHLIDRFGNNQIAAKILSGDPETWDSLINARSSFSDPAEVRPDVIASGLLNSLSENDVEIFNAFLDQSFQDLEDRYGFSREVTRRSSDPY